MTRYQTNIKSVLHRQKAKNTINRLKFLAKHTSFYERWDFGIVI